MKLMDVFVNWYSRSVVINSFLLWGNSFSFILIQITLLWIIVDSFDSYVCRYDFIYFFIFIYNTSDAVISQHQGIHE